MQYERGLEADLPLKIRLRRISPFGIVKRYASKIQKVRFSLRAVKPACGLSDRSARLALFVNVVNVVWRFWLVMKRVEPALRQPLQAFGLREQSIAQAFLNLPLANDFCQ